VRFVHGYSRAGFGFCRVWDRRDRPKNKLDNVADQELSLFPYLGAMPNPSVIGLTEVG